MAEVRASVLISPEQRNVWAHSQIAADVPLYNEAITIHRHGAFDDAIFARCLKEFVRRHEIWRTGFVLIGGEVEPVVHPSVPVSLPLVDLTHLPDGARAAEALRLAAADARVPFDVACPPLFRVQIMRLAPDEHRICMTLHHAIFDGVSLHRVLVPELAALYDAFAAGRPSPLPEPALQYADYALWRARQVESPRTAAQLDDWRATLAGDLPVLQLPTSRTRTGIPSFRGAMEVFEIPGALAETLKALGQAPGVTLYMTLLATFKALLFRYTGQTDLLVGGVADTRRRPEHQSLMGCFLNGLALR
ncbi:MAG: non-ribosomal peptide synthetase, partial [Alphaproteobacteria bacterium]|nr:non-ribosomal peptide synthetase [Alphaproteobacteria bacterium]